MNLKKLINPNHVNLKRNEGKKLNRRYLSHNIKHNHILQFIFSNKFIEEKLEFINSKLII